MLKRIKYINKEINQVLIMSENSKESWALQNGFSKELYEVEQSYDGSYYLKGFTPSQPIEDLRIIKKEEIKSKFENFINNEATVTILEDFKIDARRTDKDNIQGLIDVYKEPITYVGYDSLRPNTTLEDLVLMKNSIIIAGQESYSKKWSLEQEVNQATSKEELDNIIINFK